MILQIFVMNQKKGLIRFFYKYGTRWNSMSYKVFEAKLGRGV